MPDQQNPDNIPQPPGEPGRLVSGFIARNVTAGKTPNRLISEKSPYLLQHAFNPVDWLPWGEEAFDKARRENKIIFLSIGYSTCYWCHVMEREVFENPGIAALMNELTVNIKVDREERPDVDRIYMSAVQAMTGSGGWPMSVFLTPGLEPFFGATYIPPVASGNRPGFPDLLRRVVGTWMSEPQRISDTGRKVMEFMRSIEGPRTGAGEPRAPGHAEAAERACALLESAYDKLNAGFGAGPKFPRPCAIDFLLEHHRSTGRPEPLAMAVATLRRMASGGMYDHVGGGFHRYSVDGEWRVPHFEKMLYDQAQLVNTYLSAYQVCGDGSFRRTVEETLRYIASDLRDPAGGFCSAEDAESAPDAARPDEKSEGAFYLWTDREIRLVLGAEKARIFSRHFGVREDGNAPHDPLNVFIGKNILHRAETQAQTAASFGMTGEAVSASLSESLPLLAAARARRARPTLDDKVITAWNGLAISAFARAGRILGKAEYTAAARSAADFIVGRLFDAGSGKLMRRYREGEARFEGGLQDYAFLAAGLLDLHEATADPAYLRTAVRLTEVQVERFRDPAGGGFFDSPGGDPSIIIRMKEEYDGAEPAGNSVAALNLWRLSILTDNVMWRKLAEETARSVAANVAGRPDTAPLSIAALRRIQSGGMEIVIAGDPGAPDTASLLAEVNRRYLPDAVPIFLDGGSNQAELEARLPFLRGMGRIGGRATAYVCRNYACALPLTDPVELARLLDKANPPGQPPPPSGRFPATAP